MLRAVAEREDAPVLLADEQTYGHARRPFARLPAAADARREGVPVAALTARTPEGHHVVEELAAGTAGGIGGFFGAYLRTLFGWNVPLLTRYGIALEAHQQNVAIVPGDPIRLLIKDNDGALIDLVRLRRALGHAPAPREFHDRRLLTSDHEALARVFVTITMHLCAGAVAFGLAERRLLPLATGLGLIREHLGAALAAHDDSGFLRARTLDADRLPAKAMVTAGTLVGKDRTGAEDINKHYGPSGPQLPEEVRALTSLTHAAPPLAPADSRPRADAGEITALALLNCAVRELCAPDRQVWPAGPYLLLRLPRAGVMLRARLLRPRLMTPRLAAPVEELRDGWRAVDWRRLGDLVAGELELTTGTANAEFAEQVAASHDAVATMIREGRRPCGDPYLDSEQALLAGHRFHPSPKARQGADWPRYAPETGRAVRPALARGPRRRHRRGG